MTSDRAKRLKDLCEQFSEALSEHADAVQIMVSWNEDCQTHDIQHGNGNWYARQGMAHEFITRDQARSNAYEIGKEINDDKDDWNNK